MDIGHILTATLLVAAVGLIIGILLGYAGKIFHVEVNEKELRIREALPGNNCGACGYAGCDGLAEAIAKGEAPSNACPVGGKETAIKVGEITGEICDVVRTTAFVKCAGDCDKAKNKYEYSGSKSCQDAIVVTGNGPKACEYGCMGFADCVRACEFDAIHIINSIAYVDKEKCVSCAKCVIACPKNLIEIVPYHSNQKVMCNSKDPGKKVKTNCDIGCIACKICEKNCEFDAIHVVDNIAKVDYDKCTNCGVCAKKCPVKVITNI